MAKQRSRSKKNRSRSLPVMNPNAAGIDVGATSIFVAVPADRDAESVREFETFTEDLHALADWLQACGIETVAMESTGVYWIPLFLLLDQRGIEVCLVNASQLQRVPGRKTDVQDCEWLQYLHSVGLLRGSFHPPEAVSAVRTVLRHRANLVHMASAHIQHMQKALTQMNVQLHHVISDITGTTGLAIIDAILAGERDPEKLAQLRNSRIQASPEVLAKAMVGTWRREHLFTLGQALAAYRNYQAQIDQCDREVQVMLSGFESRVDPTTHALPPTSRRSSGPGFEMRTELYRILGTDLTAVPGLDVQSVFTLFSECGSDFSAFKSANHFASWLGLCPDNRISGGKVLSTRTRPVKQRAATVLRIAAQTLHRSATPLGEFYRRMRYRLGPAKAITATAHKLARIIYHLVTSREAYDETIFATEQKKYLQRKLHRLKNQAAALGFSLVEQPAT